MLKPLPLWRHLPAILQCCTTHEWCALCLDYDGTLTPIVADPAAAHLSPTLRQVLAALACHPRYRVAIVSGRALADVQARVAGLGLYLAGNHGLEIAGPGIAYCHPQAVQLRPQLATLAQALQHGLQGVPGAWVEDKGFTLTVHMRHVPAADVPTVQHRVRRLVQGSPEAWRLTLRTGKAVVEVRPAVSWDKGAAVRWLLEQWQRDRPAQRGYPVYMGDDETDEDVFRALGATGVGIVVDGERQHSAARYAVESPAQVVQFLAVLQALVWPARRG